MVDPGQKPRMSVVIRSYKRIGALTELLECILAQEHDSFEIVVVEQTPEPTEKELAVLKTFLADPRVRMFNLPPLGGPAARNEGVKHARGDIVLLIDDDDLPLVPDWIEAHEHAFRDSSLMGMTARMVRSPGESSPYVEFLRPFVRRTCMSYSLLKTPYTFARFDEDVARVGWLHGSNASFRREFGLRVGLWDTNVRSSDEHSFAFRAHRAMRPGDYFSYQAYPPAQQRLDIRGGMDKRYATVTDELLNNLTYCHRVVGRYFPTRFLATYPAYLGWTALKTFNWVWDPGRKHLGFWDRVRQTVRIATDLPVAIKRVRQEKRDEVT